MMPVLYTIAILILSVSFLTRFPKALDLVQTTVSASNIPANVILSQGEVVTERNQLSNPVPESRQIPPPALTATASLVEDLDSSSLLFVKNPNARVPIASTTKIVTALVGVEHYKANDVLTVPNLKDVPGSAMGVKEGEKLTFRSLLYGLLLNSGNDAAYTIAANFPGGKEAFMAAMNQRAASLGLTDTHFDNPAGFDSPYHYSSASDLSKLAVLASQDSQIARVVSTKQTEVASVDKLTIHPLKNLNRLLDEPGVLGIKTGTTPQAKENLVGLVERGGHTLLTVILGSDDRFGETDKLINWAYSNFVWQR